MTQGGGYLGHAIKGIACWVRIFSVALACLAPVKAMSFPEMVRHGYVNCTSCHVSPIGGGVLTAYGRGVSGGELLSMAGGEEETRWGYLVTPPAWANLGGDYRNLFLYRENASFVDYRSILMQADLEAAVNYSEKFYLVGSLGYADAPGPQLLSRRFYLSYRPLEQAQFRAGKFLYSYGINVPNHSIVTKRDLRINDEGTETFNLEGAWVGDSLGITATGIFGRPDSPSMRLEKGVALTSTVAVSNTYKVGVSYLHAESDAGVRDVMGPNAVLGFSTQFYLLSEIDFQNQQTQATGWGFAEYLRLGYEFFRGFHGYLTQELYRPSFASVDGIKKSYGFGFLIYPRAHFEIDASWSLQLMQGVPGYTDKAYVVLHFYP